MHDFDFSHFTSFTVDGVERKIEELEDYLNQKANEKGIITEKLKVGDQVKIRGRDFVIVINNTDCEVPGIGKVDYTGKEKVQFDDRLYFFMQNQITEIVARENEDVYAELLEELKKKFIESIETEAENEKEKEALIKGYDDYMVIAVDEMKNNDNPFLKKDVDSIKRYIKAIAKSVIEDNFDLKRRTLLNDESYEKIRYYSAKAYKAAENKLLSGGVKIELLEFDEDDVVKLLESVKPYNQLAASQLVSETVLDIEFVKKDSGIMSLRLGRLYRDLKK